MLANLEHLKNLLPEIIKISKIAGDVILEFYQGDYEIKKKSDKTKVTDADLASNEIIIKKLSILTPDIPILSEESFETNFAIRKKWQTYWLVDPLDGTTEFIDENDEFSVNIALINNHQPILGVIYSPCKRLLYYATINNGAFKTRDNALPKRIFTRKTNKKITAVIGNHSICSKELQQFIKSFDNQEFLTMGSSLKSCLVAEGQADIYPRFGPTCEWDTAAAQCIVKEAGGLIVDLAMRPLRYNKKESLLNPEFLVIGDVGYDWNNAIFNAGR